MIMTNREMLNKIAVKCADDAEIVAFCGRQIEILDNRKKYKHTSPTKTQKENAELIEKIIAYISEHEVVTCADIETAFTLSNQKASALLRQATDANRLVKTPAKGKVRASWTVA